MARFGPGGHMGTFRCAECGRAAHESQLHQVAGLQLCEHCADEGTSESRWTGGSESGAAVAVVAWELGKAVLGGLRGRKDAGVSDLDHCPYCQRPLTGFGCLWCDVEFVMQDGQLIERGLSRRRPRAERRCLACDNVMRHGGEFVHAWEDGSNADAYVRCPSCGHRNVF